MDPGWRNVSTASVELYEYQTLDGTTLIFRHRNGSHGYLACIVGTEGQAIADAHFPTIDAAKRWVNDQLTRRPARQ